MSYDDPRGLTRMGVAPQIFRGELIEYESERAVFDRLLTSLGQDGRASIILANISLGSHQIDLVVARDDLAVVIEAKGHRRALRGGENGPWEVGKASGAPKRIPNPYTQCRDAAYALRDAMRAFCGEEPPYPLGALTFVPAVPHGSQIYGGDHKVTVTGLGQLDAVLRRGATGAWPIERWLAFARHHRLTPVTVPAAAYSPELAEAERVIAGHAAAFARTYGEAAEGLIPFDCVAASGLMSSDGVVAAVVSGDGHVLLRGPSGCGKTMLATRAALQATAAGSVVILASARDYDRSHRALLERETGLLSGIPSTALLNAARRLDRPIAFLIDGYNECPEQTRASLTRGLAALARQYEASVVITSQAPIERADLLGLREIDVPSPSTETKVRIARAACGGANLPVEIEGLVNAAGSCLEARLVGELGQGYSGGSRYALFDAFARKRLGDIASEGIRALAHVAATLVDRIAFSLSVRDLERLAEAERIPLAIMDALCRHHLLMRRGDRVSFRHEMFFNAFAAEAVIRRADGQADAIRQAMEEPRHMDRRELILGAIDDESLLADILSTLGDATLVQACLTGVCGKQARDWVEAACRRVLVRASAETAKLRFVISEAGWGKIAFDPETIALRDKSEQAHLAGLAARLPHGDFLDDLLEMAAVMDERIAHERARLRPTADGQPLATPMFANAYVFSRAAAPAITLLFAAATHGFYSINTVNGAVERAVGRLLASGKPSPGQVYLLLLLCRQLRGGGACAAPLVLHALKHLWPRAPYHLKLELMYAARLGRNADDAVRTALIGAIEALPPNEHPFISTTLIEALEGLGALEETENGHQEVVRGEIEQVLAAPLDAYACMRAHSIFYAQFDHPLAGAYNAVIADLPEDDRKQLLIMASKGADGSSFFLQPLIVELAACGDQQVSQHIARWCQLPPRDSFMPQDAIAVFATAHICLGRLGCALPTRTAVPALTADAALMANGEILYWLNRVDLGETARREASRTALQLLKSGTPGTAIDGIKLCEEALVSGLQQLPGEQPRTSIVEPFADDVAGICRVLLERQSGVAVRYFPHPPEMYQNPLEDFAVRVLGRFGNVADLVRLRLLASDPALGRSAIAAVRQLEERLASSLTERQT